MTDQTSQALDDWATTQAPDSHGRTRLYGTEAADAARQLLAHAAGKPTLGHTHAQHTGRSPRRQVRLPEDINRRLDAYAAATGRTPSEVIRDALTSWLTNHAA